MTGSVTVGQDEPNAQKASDVALLASGTQYIFLAGQLTLVGQHVRRPVLLNFPSRTVVGTSRAIDKAKSE